MKIGERGQVTIPKELRERYGLHKDSEVDFVPQKGGILVQKRTQGKHPVDKVYGTMKLRFADSVDEYIEEIRGR